jgi:hypothetical protein
MKKFLILLFFSSFLVPPAYSQEQTVWEYVDERLEKKEFKRWSLSTWLYDKEKMRLQDQWLLLNTDNDGWFTEFYIDYATSDFDRDTANNNNQLVKGTTGELAAYLGFLGVTGRFEQYDSLYEQTEYSLALRLIGSSVQSTHLALHYGQRKFIGTVEETFDQSFYGGDIALYLTSFLGFDGRYRKYAEVNNQLDTYKMSSTRSQWGIFIDIWAIRLFAYQFEENLEFEELGVSGPSELQIKGTATGLRIYF